MSDFLVERHEALTVAIERQPVATREIPLKLESAGNGRGHSRWRGVQTAQNRRYGVHLAKGLHHWLLQAPWWVVLLTRVAPRELDSDNLEAAFKAIRDGVAQELGVNDRSPRVRYVVDQVKGPVALVRLELLKGGNRE